MITLIITNLPAQVTRTLALGALAVSLSAQTVQDGNRSDTYVVNGRVIDSRGQPSAHARVIIEAPSPEDTLDSLVVHHEVDAEGRFHLEETATLPIEKRVLYVITPLPLDVHAPILPPFRQLNSTDRAFAGLPILIKKNQRVDVGDVPVQVRYGEVLVYLRDEKDGPLFNVFTNDSDLPHFQLRVRDYRGDVVGEGGVAHNAFRRTQSAIALALPEGRWQVEIALAARDMIWHSLPEPLNVQASAASLERTLKFRAGGNRLKTLHVSPASNKEVSREELERMAISYTEDAFIERAERCNTVAVELFLAAGMDPNAKKKDGGDTALIAAARRECSEVVESVLRRGANVNAKNEQGATAMLMAAGGFNNTIVRNLLNHGADVNSRTNDGFTALMFAAANNQSDNVRILLRAGADVGVKNKDGKTALAFASELGRLEIVELLKSAGAKN
jgi:Ankyrin repeats (3 copies)/Ankyrin repeat